VTPEGLAVSATIGVLGTVAPFSLYLLAVESIGPARAAAASTLEPVFGGLAAFVLSGEVPTVLQAAGGAVIVLAVLLLEWKGPRAVPGQPPSLLRRMEGHSSTSHRAANGVEVAEADEMPPSS
jgi:drug/metabolite transporter (DMT)-like permease